MPKRSKKTSPKNSYLTTKSEFDIIAYTDGGCLYNPGGPGGYGVVIINNKTGTTTEFSEGYESTTNNRMEVMAVIRAIKETAKYKCPILIISDSKYAIHCATGAWARNVNNDLWQEYDKTAKGRDIAFKWTRGHSGESGNERCDTLATEAANSNNRKEDIEYIKPRDTAARQDNEDSETGAMAAAINIPEDLDKAPEFMSVPQYIEKYCVNTSCAVNIIDFYIAGIRSFKAYAEIKTGGTDEWSRKPLGKVAEIVGDNTWNTIRANLKNSKQQLAAARWACRGLKLSDAIRKVLVDEEVSDNVAKKQRWSNDRSRRTREAIT